MRLHDLPEFHTRDRPDATAAALRGGWLHLGDAGTLDEEGSLGQLTGFIPPPTFLQHPGGDSNRG